MDDFANYREPEVTVGRSWREHWVPVVSKIICKYALYEAGYER